VAKRVSDTVKLQLPAGQATPGPPVGVALGPRNVNPGRFVQQFNEATKDQMGTIVGCVITIYEDKSFSFVIKSPPAAVLLKKAASVAKGSGVPNKDKVGTVTRGQMEEIAKQKMKDLNASSLDQAVKMIAGTARSMGIEVAEAEAAE
jgi:large subunit ribosomal protein L11